MPVERDRVYPLLNRLGWRGGPKLFLCSRCPAFGNVLLSILPLLFALALSCAFSVSAASYPLIGRVQSSVSGPYVSPLGPGMLAEGLLECISTALVSCVGLLGGFEKAVNSGGGWFPDALRFANVPDSPGGGETGADSLLVQGGRELAVAPKMNRDSENCHSLNPDRLLAKSEAVCSSPYTERSACRAVRGTV